MRTRSKGDDEPYYTTARDAYKISANVPTSERQWFGQRPGFPRLMSLNHPAEQPVRPDIVRFVIATLARRRTRR